MRIHRFLIDFPLTAADGVLNDHEIVHQMTKVLRLQKGEQVELFNKTGEEAKVLISEITPNKVFFVVLEKEKNETEAKKVILAAAIVKRDNFEWIVQKATEIGVTEIIPLHTQHSIKFGVQIHRLQKISEEAAEQCGRRSVPVIREPEEFMDVLANSKEKNKYFFDMGGKSFGTSKKSDSIILFVGPEGGWSEGEREEAKKAGCETMSLGKTVLRSETAATVASYLAVN
ncbi:MAG: RsmE family RNA methyltransferase [Patescibacteria group bacterium]|jgi:16S rRNA (uracil1498-N3)-methyltransferase